MKKHPREIKLILESEIARTDIPQLLLLGIIIALIVMVIRWIVGFF